MGRTSATNRMNIPRSNTQRKETSTMSNDEQRSHDRGTHGESRSDCEWRSRPNHRNGDTQRGSEGDRSVNRNEQNNPKRPDYGRDRSESTEERRRKRTKRHLVDILASLPAQPMHSIDHQFNDVSHPRCQYLCTIIHPHRKTNPGSRFVHKVQL